MLLPTHLRHSAIATLRSRLALCFQGGEKCHAPPVHGVHGDDAPGLLDDDFELLTAGPCMAKRISSRLFGLAHLDQIGEIAVAKVSPDPELL